MKENVGKRIKLLRVQYGYSQSQVAEKLGISRSAFERMENGSSNSWASHLEKLSEVFGVKPEYFVRYQQNHPL